MPTSSSRGRRPAPDLAMICCSTAGAILQPQPPPWLNSVRRNGTASGAFMTIREEDRAGGRAHRSIVSGASADRLVVEVLRMVRLREEEPAFGEEPRVLEHEREDQRGRHVERD